MYSDSNKLLVVIRMYYVCNGYLEYLYLSIFYSPPAKMMCHLLLYDLRFALSSSPIHIFIRLRYRLTRFKYLLPGEKLDRHKNSPSRYISGFKKKTHFYFIYMYVFSYGKYSENLYTDLHYIFRFHFFLLENENISLSWLSKHGPLLLCVF